MFHTNFHSTGSVWIHIRTFFSDSDPAKSFGFFRIRIRIYNNFPRCLLPFSYNCKFCEIVIPFLVTAVHKIGGFHSRISPRIRSYIEKGFNPCIRSLFWWSKWSKISCQVPLLSKEFLQCIFLPACNLWGLSPVPSSLLTTADDLANSEQVF
jgi:hypothetical protein